jgi:hypothetical protein
VASEWIEADIIVDRWLDYLIEQTRTRMGVLIRNQLEQSVGRVVKRELRSAGTIPPSLFEYLVQTYQDDVSHVRDWLVGAVQRGDSWLARVGDDGVPLKLAKFGTMEQIVNEADKAMRKLNAASFTAASYHEVIHTFDNGFKLVSLQSEQDLKSESAMMRHCVGHGGYDFAVSAGLTRILSLRDPHGKAHATVEIDMVDDTVNQVKGKQNKVPKAEYFDLVAEWLAKTDYRFISSDLPSSYAVARHGNLVKLSSLGPGEEFDGDLEIHIRDDEEMPSLADGIVVGGNLTIRAHGDRTRHLVLPKGISASGSFRVVGLAVDQTESFPGCDLGFDRCRIERLPSIIPEDVRFVECEIGGVRWQPVEFSGRVTIASSESKRDALDKVQFLSDVTFHNGRYNFHDGTVFHGKARFIGTYTAFAGHAEIKGDMLLEGGRIDREPKSLNVGGNLRADGTAMKALPLNTSIALDLTLIGNQGMLGIPAEIKIGRNIVLMHSSVITLNGRVNYNGDLFVRGGALEAIPEGSHIAGSLHIEAGALDVLPSALHVAKDVIIRKSRIKAIPPSMTVGRHLCIGESDIHTLPAGYNVPGDLDISSSAAFSFPENVTVGGAVIASRAGLQSIPASVSMGALYASGSELRSLPDGFSVEGNLDLKSSYIRRLPEDLYVGGKLDVSGTVIVRVPASAEIVGNVVSDDFIVMDKTAPGPTRRLGP